MPVNQSADDIAAAPVPLGRDAAIISLVGFVHLVSHFFQLLMAPMFPWLRDDFGFSYAELGFIMTVLFVVSALGQAAAGFLVDRIGAMTTLIGGLISLAAGALVFSMAPGYGALCLAAVLIGLGNAVFHPVDFWLLNHRVSTPRLGPAFSNAGIESGIHHAIHATGRTGWCRAADQHVA